MYPNSIGDDTSNPPEPCVHSRKAIIIRLTINPNPIVVSPKYIPVIRNAGKPITKPNNPAISGDIINDNANGTPN